MDFSGDIESLVWIATERGCCAADALVAQKLLIRERRAALSHCLHGS